MTDPSDENVKRISQEEIIKFAWLPVKIGRGFTWSPTFQKFLSLDYDRMIWLCRYKETITYLNVGKIMTRTKYAR